ncbi:hypothetical protein D3C84_572770 [compost metagenome]
MFAHKQAVGDLGIGGPRHQVTDYLLFTGRQQRLVAQRLATALAVVIHQITEQVARDPILPLQHLADADHQPIQAVLAEEEPAGVRPHQQQLPVRTGGGIEQHCAGPTESTAKRLAPVCLLSRLEVIQIDQEQGLAVGICRFRQGIQLSHQQDGPAQLLAEVTLKTDGLCVMFGDQH